MNWVPWEAQYERRKRKKERKRQKNIDKLRWWGCEVELRPEYLAYLVTYGEERLEVSREKMGEKGVVPYLLKRLRVSGYDSSTHNPRHRKI